MTPCFRFYPTFTMHVFVVFSLANVAFTGLFFSLFITFSMQIFSDQVINIKRNWQEMVSSRPWFVRRMEFGHLRLVDSSSYIWSAAWSNPFSTFFGLDTVNSICYAHCLFILLLYYYDLSSLSFQTHVTLSFFFFIYIFLFILKLI